MAITAAFDLDTKQFDAVNAFLNSRLDEVVYTHIPEGFQVKGKAWRLSRALYGLRKSPRLWQRDLATTLQEFGLTQVPEEECLFTNNHLVVMVFVDDIITANKTDPESRRHAQLFKQALAKRYEVRSTGEIKWFLRVRVIRDRPQRKLWLC